MIEKLRQQRMGEVFILLSGVLDGLFPIIINYSVKIVPPLFFAGIGIMASTGLFLGYILIFRMGAALRLKLKDFQYILGIIAFIIVIPNTLIFIGTAYTSGINTSLLLRTEVLFTFLICGWWLKEEVVTGRKIFGAAVVTLGTILVLYNGNFQINLGDILIILGTALFPLGNICAKRALRRGVAVAVILFYRALGGGLILLTMSVIFEGGVQNWPALLKIIWPMILVMGFFILFIEKIFWYEGIKRIDITLAIALVTAAPAFSLIFAMIFLNEYPSWYQIAGMFLAFVGVGLLITKESRNKTHSLID